ncbi:uncharacterized protein LOC129252836 [Anastrepha obliqua]|uniref:uncharacterized protein LOC129252836 n=1 Tax=Anastrepha obliqua TaxID=95512 RepID=UPI002409D0C6|nr:uncharacterized protein LOC129252836 [Anastrepha obliqua]
MSLPKFKGEYSEFKNFMSLFESLVHNDPTIPEIEKFNHLVNCLSGEALGTVKAFQMSDENYSKALASLKKVYDNKCLIFFDTISKLFELPTIPKPSALSLRTMIDTVSAVYDSLLSLGDEKNITNAIIIHLVMSKVDTVTRSKWEEQLDYDKLPLWRECEAALNKRYQHLSADEASTSRLKPSSSHSIQKPHLHAGRTKAALVTSNIKQPVCPHCKSNDHSIPACPSFKTLSAQQRFEFAKSVPLCINCLRKGHSVSKCKADRCRVCNRSHHTLLHQYPVSFATAPQLSTSHAMHTTSTPDRVMLATAVVNVKGSSGEYLAARALLDSGSQVNFMTEDLAQKLRIRRESTTLNIIGIGNATKKVRTKLNTFVKSRVNNYEFSAQFWIMRSISASHPDRNVNINGWKIPKNISLAVPEFYKAQKVDLLLGAETFFELLAVGQIKASPNHPTLQKTLLGWVVSGKYASNQRPPPTVSSTLCHTEQDLANIDSIVQRFWAMEEIPSGASSTKFTPEQIECEKFFVKTTKVLPSGRLQVRLPFKDDRKLLGNSYETASRRFQALERKTLKDPELRQMYLDFMNEYIELGHMSPTNNKIPSEPHYFIPHQCVLRPESTTTKLRVVFDASSRTSSQIALNEILMVGPTIQEELYSTLLRFRLHKYAFTADITKMYRQILMHEEDKNFQLVMWRRHPSEPLQIFRLNTVTYGTAPAPFLATRCLQMLSDANTHMYPLGSKAIKRDFYVDDLLTGSDNFESLDLIRSEVVKILNSAGFNLSKWFSNHPSFFDCESSEKALNFNHTDSTKTLGIHWLPKEDLFRFVLNDNFTSLRATKRNILSVSARLFDPLGLLAPLVTKAKILLQELWLQKLDWDESIPLHLDTSWENFKANLLQLPSISIPRFVHTESSASCQIHGFADASIRAYGCCIYIRSHSAGGTKCTLLTAKSRVAPLKTKSLPRLELSAAHLLAKLWSRIAPMLSRPIENINFWTDSEIILHWIKTHPSVLQTFVANRVSEIQELTDKATWRHVPTKQNPADQVSRGCNVDELNNSIWFSGPQFLLEDPALWPTNTHFQLSPGDEALEKKRNATVLVVQANESHPIMELTKRVSSHQKLLRIVAYILRWIKRIRNPSATFTQMLTAEDIKLSFLKVIQVVQHVEYGEEIMKLTKGTTLPSSLQKLNPFLHNYSELSLSFNLLRVGGRLLNAPLPYDAKFPLLLNNNSHFVTTYLRDQHFRNHHAGAKALVALLRDGIWLVNAREACSRTVRNCTHCFHYKPKLQTQIMGNLPADRLRALRPFLICGVDFCGPVYTTLKIRGRRPVKTYIAVFVCFTSKAVHLELVTDLSSNCFIFALKRFIGRRGMPRKIYSDNATNFVGADRKLRELRDAFEAQQPEVQKYATDEEFTFAFIPPRAPHFGGLWEAAVKSAKHLLVRAIGNALLTAEELQTLLVEVEAVLNSRPLVPLSQDPNDGEALTPAHLLVGCPLRALPPAQVSMDPMRCCDRWQLVCCLKQQFWRLWSRNYLLGLQQRNKWLHPKRNLELNDLVLVQEDNTPPQQWVLGRVAATVTGQDGKVRVADVATKAGVIKRPVHKLAVLPLDVEGP